MKWGLGGGLGTQRNGLSRVTGVEVYSTPSISFFINACGVFIKTDKHY
jgi:hypothetical protein